VVVAQAIPLLEQWVDAPTADVAHRNQAFGRSSSSEQVLVLQNTFR